MVIKLKEEIEILNPNFVDTFNELTSLDDVRYLYHVTNVDPNLILEEGLFLQENDIFTTTIEIPKEFFNDPIQYCLDERGKEYRENPYIVLLGIPIEHFNTCVVKNYKEPSIWDKEQLPKFIIPSEYILGYIDTNNFNITINENYELINEHYL